MNPWIYEGENQRRIGGREGQIADDFNSPNICELLTRGSQSTDRYLQAENRRFSARVSEEFDRDYGSWQIRVNRCSLGAILGGVQGKQSRSKKQWTFSN